MFDFYIWKYLVHGQDQKGMPSGGDGPELNFRPISSIKRPPDKSV